MKPIINREARSKYEYLDSWEAGLVLTGAEVKSTKNGQMNMKGAYIGIENNELWLKNAHIAFYQRANQDGYDPDRARKLLLTTHELNAIFGKLQEKGLTLIPEKVYSKSGLLKITVRLARGLKSHDKREKIKKRDDDRNIRRAVKERYR